MPSRQLAGDDKAVRAEDPRRRFLEAAEEIFRKGGLKKLTFDAVASKLGVSKQAVIHWYPTKSHLIGALLVPALREEAEAVITACQEVPGRKSLRDGLTALATFHLGDLERFRMIYLAPQAGGISLGSNVDISAQIHQTTSAMYHALAGCIPDRPPEQSRLEAASLHAAVIGVVTMVALGEGVGDPMKYGGMEQARCLIDRICPDPQP
jgi:AcrR family transcriptional regulator